MKKQTNAAISHHMSATEDNDFHEEGKLTTYRQIVNYLLETYGTDHVIFESQADMINS